MDAPHRLLEREDHWVTEKGAWFPGERVVFRGKDLFHELNHLSWMALLLFGITGRILNEKQLRLLESFWTLCISYPDPRLWNNRVAALAGTARSTATLAISGATATSEASIYGHRPIIRAIDFLFRVQAELDRGAELAALVFSELRRHRVIAGYGRPVTRTDERIAPLMTLARDLGFAHGPYVKLAFEVEEILVKGRRRHHMNVAGLAAALAADVGLSSEEYLQFLVLGFSGGMFPCYADTLSQPPGTFFPLRCSRLRYHGKCRRAWSATIEPHDS